MSANPSLQRGRDGRLVITRTDGDGNPVEVPVQVALCFPWSHPEQYVSLRNDRGEEEAFLEDYAQMPEPARELIIAEIRQRYFVARIVEVEAIVDEAELFRWRVITDAGPRTFLAPRTERPRKLKDGSVVVRDVCLDSYLVDLEALDARSRRRLSLYLD